MTTTAPAGLGMEPLPGIDRDLRVPERVEGETIQERFERFHELNPQVYEALRRLALELVRQGRRRIGIGMLFEVLRWQRLLVTSGDEWKLNNNYRSRYARKLAADAPELADAFETRELHSD